MIKSREFLTSRGEKRASEADEEELKIKYQWATKRWQRKDGTGQSLAS
jgi:hypothetical protein